ncbi:MAG: hypothetical protein FWD38_06230 [Oscillospiraceae bacterium]|nr:hypothetical protein [Oscillospiraceae bacterium]
MLNEARIEDLSCEIRKIEGCREEADSFLSKCLLREGKMHEELQDSIRKLGSSFDACCGDSRWTALVEEKYNLLLSAERCCSESIEGMQKVQKEISEKCASNIEDLKYEIQMIGGEMDD